MISKRREHSYQSDIELGVVLESISHASVQFFNGYVIFYNNNFLHMHFAIGTTNAPKSEAIEYVLATSPYTSGASFSPHKVPSGVPDMPTTLQELRTGAKNRAIYTRREEPNADFFVGMEGGVYQDSE